MTINHISSRRHFAMAAGAATLGLVGVTATPALATPTTTHDKLRGCPDIADGGLLAPTNDLVKAQVAAIDRLAFMLGTWDGTGWQLGENGQRMNFRQVEQVDRYLAGQLLTVQGRSTALTRPHQVLFRAFATLGYDPAAHAYLWLPQSTSGTGASALHFEATADGYVWELPLGGPAKVRYQAHFSGPRKRQWDQVGHFTDGVNQVQTFEMHVRRCSR